MPNINPDFDLVLERTLDVTPAQAFKAWTTPELMGDWFCPKPWTVTEARVDLKPGGEFFTVMEGPEGQRFDNAGCFLEVVPDRKLVWTSALLPGFRPVAQPENGPDMPFTCVLTFEPVGDHQTKYKALAMHKDEADRKKHEEMGFYEGWGICADQLVTLMKTK